MLYRMDAKPTPNLAILKCGLVNGLTAPWSHSSTKSWNMEVIPPRKSVRGSQMLKPSVFLTRMLINSYGRYFRRVVAVFRYPQNPMNP